MALWMEAGSEPKTESEVVDLEAISALKQSTAIELKVSLPLACLIYSELLSFFCFILFFPGSSVLSFRRGGRGGGGGASNWVLFLVLLVTWTITLLLEIRFQM